MAKESGYYPPGAEFDPNAPWNQPDAQVCAHCDEELDPDTFVEDRVNEFCDEVCEYNYYHAEEK